MSEKSAPLLYNIYNHREWLVEAEDQSFQIPKTGELSVWSILRGAGSVIKSNVNNVVFPLHPTILTGRHAVVDWKIAYNAKRKLLAVLGEKELHLVSMESNFMEILASCSISKYSNSKWEMLEWDPSGSFLFHYSCKGNMAIYDNTLAFTTSLSVEGGSENKVEGYSEGLEFFETIDIANCACSMSFDYKEDQVAVDAFILTYRGVMHSIRFEMLTLELRKLYSVNLSQFYKNGGVFCMVYSPFHHLFITGSAFSSLDSSLLRESERKGLLQWRLLDSHPWLATADGDSSNGSLKSSSVKAWSFPKVFPRHSSEVTDAVAKLVLSQDEMSLFAVNCFGSVTQWTVPALTYVREIRKEEICSNIDTSEVLFKADKVSDHCDNSDSVCDLQIWDDDRLVFAKYSGLMDIQDVKEMKSVIGKSEMFSSPAHFSPVFRIENDHQAFIGIEMERKVSRAKQNFKISESSADHHDDDDSSDDEAYQTLRQRSSRYVSKGLYFLTESDKFQPPKKKPKLVTKIYRIFSFRSTTPEALFKIKLQNEEYGEALILAKQFDLDSDLVHMRQWRKHAVSKASIQDYLRKISKRHWILRECLSRVSEDLDATKALLNYGLIGTELEVLIHLGQTRTECLDDSSYQLEIDEYSLSEEDAYLTMHQIEEKKKSYRSTKVALLLKKLESMLNENGLTVEQKEILQSRRKLVHYLQTLLLYEDILGGAETAVQNFSSDEYLKIRDQSLLKTTIEFAQSSNWKAVDTMLMHVEKLDQSRLLILSNFPESMNVDEYCELLPAMARDGKVKDLFLSKIFDEDWSFSKPIDKLLPVSLEVKNVNLDKVPEILKSSDKWKSAEFCCDWYKWRARQIESVTGIVSNSCTLLQIGIKNEFQGLAELFNDLSFFSSIVYESQCNILLPFEEFEKCSEFDRMNLILQNSSIETICKDILKFIKPRLNTLSVKSHEQLFRQLLISLSLSGLSKVVKIYEASKPNSPEPIEPNQLLLMKNAVDCVYNCPRTDQLSEAYAIINCLPLKSSGKFGPQYDDVFKAIETLKTHLQAASILEKFEIYKPLINYQQIEIDYLESVKLLRELIATIVKQQRFVHAEDWLNFLVHSFFQLQRKLTKIVSSVECFQIFVTQLLRSENVKLTKLAFRFLTFSAAEKEVKFSYANIVSYKLPFQESCEIFLVVSQEFVDSASSVRDSCILAAGNLLKKVENAPECIEKEKNFIEMLVILQEYNVNLLPVVIRTKYNFESIVNYILNENVTAYKNWKRMLKIASLFKYNTDCGDEKQTENEKKARVCALVAAKSLDGSYVDLAIQMCLLLIELEYKDAWLYCWNVVQMTDLKDIEIKQKLLSFVTLYCPADILSQVVEFKSNRSVMRKVLGVQTLFTEEPKLSGDRKTLFPVLDTLEKTGKSLMKETQQTTQLLLRKPTGLMHFSRDFGAEESRMSGLKFSFYDSEIPSHDNLKLIDSQACKLGECFLQLTESYSEGQISAVAISEKKQRDEKIVKILEECAIESFPKDFIFSLACLLACDDHESMNRFLERLPKSEQTMHMSILTTAIPSLISNAESRDKLSFLQNTPTEIVSLAKTEENEKLEEALKSLHTFVESHKLSALNSSIDVSRFGSDEEYRLETVLGLAGTNDRQLNSLALDLADRHGIDQWELHLCTLKYAFTSSNTKLSAQNAIKYVKEMNLVSQLKEKEDLFVKKLESEVFENIAENDLERLRFFFEILSSLRGSSEMLKKAKSHTGILTLVKKIAPSLPYKRILLATPEDSEEIHELIARVCTPSNYDQLSNELTKASQNGLFINKSKVICNYASYLFFECEQKPDKVEEISSLLRTCIDLLKPEELKKFAEIMCYQNDEIRVTNLGFISGMVRKCMGASRRVGGSKKKAKQNNAESVEKQAEVFVEKLNTEIEKLARNGVVSSWLESDDALKSGAAKAFWLARGEKDTIDEILVGLVFAGVNFEDINKAISSLKVQTNLTNVVLCCMERCIEDIAIEGLEKLQLSETSKPLIQILSNVKSHLNDKGSLINETRVIEKLREITSHENFSTDAKIHLLEKCEKLFSLNDEDLKSLLHVRTKTLLDNLFSESVFSEDDLSSEEGRYILVCDLVDCSVQVEQFERLLKLIDVWPPFREHFGNQHPLCAIFCKWIQSNPEKALHQLTLVLNERKNDSVLKDAFCEVVDFCFDSGLEECGVVFGLQLNSPSVASKLVNILNDPESELELPVSTFSDLVSCGILPKIATSRFYEQVVDYIIEEQNRDLMSKVVQQLNEDGFEIEAADILSRFSDVHPTFSTISASVNYLKSWLR